MEGHYSARQMWVLKVQSLLGMVQGGRTDHLQCNIPAHASELFQSNLEDRLLAEEVCGSLRELLAHLGIDLITNLLQTLSNLVNE